MSDVSPNLKRALSWKTGTWFTVTDVTGGQADQACWLQLHAAVQAHYMRSNGDLLIESNRGFLWFARRKARA